MQFFTDDLRVVEPNTDWGFECYPNIDLILLQYTTEYPYDIVKPSQLHCCDHILHSSQHKFGGYYKDYFYAPLHEPGWVRPNTVIPYVPPPPSHPAASKRTLLALFIVREKKRRIINQDELADILRSRGFEVRMVVLEKLEHHEQFYLMREACVLVGAHGAGMMNGIFMPEQAVVVQLVPNFMGLHKDWKKFLNYGSMMEQSGLFYFEWRDELTDMATDIKLDYKTINTYVPPHEFAEIVDRACQVGLPKQLLKERFEN